MGQLGTTFLQLAIFIWKKLSAKLSAIRTKREKRQMFKHLNELVLRLAARQTRYLELRDQMLLRKSKIPKQKLDQALQYEQLLARIGELDHIIEHIIHAANLDQIDFDLRTKDRRRSRDRRQLTKTVV